MTVVHKTDIAAVLSRVRLLRDRLSGGVKRRTLHFLALATDRGMTAEQLLKLPYYHPCLEEALHTAILDAYQQLNEETAIPVQLKGPVLDRRGRPE